MARGDGGKVIFIAKDDHLALATSLRARTAMGNEWVVKQLYKWAMTGPPAV